MEDLSVEADKNLKTNNNVHKFGQNQGLVACIDGDN